MSRSGKAAGSGVPLEAQAPYLHHAPLLLHRSLRFVQPNAQQRRVVGAPASAARAAPGTAGRAGEEGGEKLECS